MNYTVLTTEQIAHEWANFAIQNFNDDEIASINLRFGLEPNAKFLIDWETFGSLMALITSEWNTENKMPSSPEDSVFYRAYATLALKGTEILSLKKFPDPDYAEQDFAALDLALAMTRTI